MRVETAQGIPQGVVEHMLQDMDTMRQDMRILRQDVNIVRQDSQALRRHVDQLVRDGRVRDGSRANERPRVAVEEAAATRFDEQVARFDQRFDQQEARFNERFDQQKNRFDQRFDQQKNRFDKRFDRLEAQLWNATALIKNHMRIATEGVGNNMVPLTPLRKVNAGVGAGIPGYAGPPIEAAPPVLNVGDLVPAPFFPVNVHALDRFQPRDIQLLCILMNDMGIQPEDDDAAQRRRLRLFVAV